MADRPSVGFVGVGNMGWPMASCLVKAGFSVHVNDARREIAFGADADHTEMAKLCEHLVGAQLGK